MLLIGHRPAVGNFPNCTPYKHKLILSSCQFLERNRYNSLWVTLEIFHSFFLAYKLFVPQGGKYSFSCKDALEVVINSRPKKTKRINCPLRGVLFVDLRLDFCFRPE